MSVPRPRVNVQAVTLEPRISLKDAIRCRVIGILIHRIRTDVLA